MGLKIGSKWCSRCKHYWDNHPIICRKCLECEETSVSPTNYDPQAMEFATTTWPPLQECFAGRKMEEKP